MTATHTLTPQDAADINRYRFHNNTPLHAEVKPGDNFPLRGPGRLDLGHGWIYYLQGRTGT